MEEQKMADGGFESFETISTYSRAEAIEDGVLVDVTEIAKEAGFTVPVAVTRNLWDTWIEPPAKLVQYGQSCEGRLWDVLWMLRLKAKLGGDRITYEVLFLNTPKRHKTVQLVSVIGPGDTAEPVITIMLPEDD